LTHDDLNPAERLQLAPSHDRGNEGIGQDAEFTDYELVAEKR